MKRTLLFASAGFLALGAAAAAGNDVKLDFDDFTLAGGESITFEFELGEGSKVVTGFSFTGHYDDLANDASWAADLRMDLTIGEHSFAYGGFDDPGTLWDFDGPVSDLDGTYTHDGHGTIDEIELGSVDVTFTNDWIDSGGHTWSDVSITIHMVPAPGALALLGVAGLVARRRRRV